MAVIAKRSVMTLYSNPLDPYSHQVRIVLAEKGVSADIINVSAHHPSEDLLQLNPYNTLPTLVDRDLVLFEARIIMEYLDERFPHPPLLPVYPVSRAQCRLMMYRIEHDWYSLMRKIDPDNLAGSEAARKELKDSIVSVNALFAEKPFFLNDEFTLVDCKIAPLLWRLPYYGIDVPEEAKAIHHYMTRVFDREAFRFSLSEAEREIHQTKREGAL